MTDSERGALLAIARAAITARVSGVAPADPTVAGPLARPGAAFVTLRRHDSLRGCIGYTKHDRPLAEVVMQCAVSAATKDPRFPPVAPDELSAVAVEISVLTPMVCVQEVDAIVVGRDGLMVSDGPRHGLLLPQVATEFGWDRETFLSQTCLKAGLDPDAWKSGASILRFEAEVFCEDG